MIEFLKQYQEIITLFFTIAVGISTVVYSFITAKLLSETKRMRKSQTDPEIFVSLVQNESSILFIDLLVENIGMGPAYNIKFEVIKDFELSKRMLSEVGFIKDGINYFSPKQSMRVWVASFISDKELKNKSIDIKVIYRNSIYETFSREFTLNFSQFASITQLGRPPIHTIAEKITNIERSINNIASGSQKLRIDVYDSVDRKLEQKQLDEEYEEFKKSQK
ncbi:MAG: hypothetical protein Q8940_07390 [Bacteroidota bacterium]|nr:hypothetical protein [Bacteroidota bacterium]